MGAETPRENKFSLPPWHELSVSELRVHCRGHAGDTEMQMGLNRRLDSMCVQGNKRSRGSLVSNCHDPELPSVGYPGPFLVVHLVELDDL